jgi:outer membrane receptor protein involved in Fe transport
MRRIRPWRLPVYCLSFLSLGLPLFSQDDDDEDEIFELNPFQVTAEDSDGYSATATLAGTRVRTDLRDLAASISVVTAQYLEDTGSRNNLDLLVYTPGTEVGGLYGNFSGVANTQGANESRNLSSPSTNTRVRGLDAADNTRDWFQSDIPWESYNVERVELQRGPNSILFGVGSPAGIINNSLTPAVFRDLGKIQFDLDKEGSLRAMLNVNQEIIEDVFAFRVAGVYNDRQYQQEPAFERTKRWYLASRIDLRPLGREHGPLTFRANFESGDVDSNRPRSLPPNDRITPWWTGLGQAVYDPQWAWNAGAVLDRGNDTRARANFPNHAPWLGESMSGVANRPIFFFGPSSSDPFMISAMDPDSTAFGIGADGSINRSINSWEFRRMTSVAGFNEYSKNAHQSAIRNGLPSPYPGADRDYYKDKVLSDPSVFDFYNRLLDGNNKREWQDWKAYNLALSQSFFGDRFGFEFVVDWQEFTNGSEGLLGWSTFIGIDTNSYTTRIPTAYPARAENVAPLQSEISGGQLNPNVGRAFTSGGGGGDGSERITERDSLRGTAFLKLNASDVFEAGSLIERILGRHLLTGVVSRTERTTTNRSWNLFAMDQDYSAAIDDRATARELGSRGLSYLFYLSDDLRGVSTSRGLGLRGINTFFNPHGNTPMQYFNSRWKHPTTPGAPGYVDPSVQDFGKPWNPRPDGLITQSENWQNYVGWTNTSFNVLNVRRGDKDQLYKDASQAMNILESVGLTWQGHFFEETVVPTFGWRRDKVENFGSFVDRDPVTRVPDPNVRANRDSGVAKDDGESITWGVVVHAPRFIERHLPQGMTFSLFYNDSENFDPRLRVQFDTTPLPPPAGESQDYGFVISAFDNRLTLKTTFFETTVKNADLPSGSPLGSNQWFLYRMEAFAVAAAYQAEMYWRGETPGPDWRVNYALIDANKWGNPDWIPDLDPDQSNNINNPGYRPVGISDEAWAHPTMALQFAAIRDAYANARPQAFYDGYGLPIDISKVGTLEGRRTMIRDGAWNPDSDIGSINSTTGGRVNGLNPTGAIDQKSEGIEIELTARILPNWNLSFNATKTEATRGDLNAGFIAFIEDQHEKLQGPMGDLRLWWGGDTNYRTYYDQFIWQPYRFQQAQKGAPAPEIREWRFNLVTNYSFNEGRFKGLNVGLGYRWQDDLIVGNELNMSNPSDIVLDFTKPIKAAQEDALDLWVGYERKLSDTVRWKIQLNVRGVGQNDRLIPVSINPDGSYATQRIAYGQSWSISNTFSW